MKHNIDDGDIWWFREIYSVLSAFADDPNNTISRMGSGGISVPDDRANQLDHFLNCIRDKYPDFAGSHLMRAAMQIDDILTQHSAGGTSFDERFWTNDGFKDHAEWQTIRTLAREFLIR